MIFALFAVVFVLAIFGVFAVVIVKGLGAKGEMDAVEGRIRAGDVTGLAEWSAALFPWLSKDVIGGSYYYRPMGGDRTTRLTATVPAWQGSAVLLALHAESTPRKGRGSIDILTRGPRINLVLDRGLWFVRVDGQPFGAIDPRAGRLDDVGFAPIGWYRRESGATQVQLRGRELACIDGGAELHAAHPSHLRPLLRQGAPTDAEGMLWLLALVGMELGSALMATHGAPLTGVP